MKVQHNICIDVHDIMVNKLSTDSSIEEIVLRVIEDYKAQLNVNILLDAMLFDKFLMDCTVGEFYGNNGNIKSLNNISYKDFYILVLKTLNKKVVNELVDDIIIDKDKNIKIIFKYEDKYFETLDFINKEKCDIINNRFLREKTS